MSFIQALVLGAVQGATEFLPVSSSAHLVLVPWFSGWKDPGLAYDVALHLGTLAAVALYFARDWLAIVRSGLTQPRGPEGRRLWMLAAATLPGAVAGLLLEDLAEKAFRHPAAIAANLMAFGLLMGWAEARGAKRLGDGEIGWKEALGIGAAQALAIMPGVSRSGVTLTAGLLLGLTPHAAARFSFLLSTPLLAGAGLLELRKLAATPMDASFWLGIAASAAVGLASIGFLMNYLKTRSLKPFVVYRVVLGVVILLAFLRQ